MIDYILNPYLINILLMIFWGFTILGNNNIKNPKKIFVIIATIQWILLSGLRHVSIGADTLAYRDNFYDISNQSWSTLFENFRNIIIFGQEGKDPGYTLFVKFIQLFTLNYQLYLIIIAMIFIIPMGKLIYKHSKEPLISFILFSTLFYSFFAITGHRQTIATALVVLIGYNFIIKRKLIPFLFLVGIAFTVHKSSLVFIPFYFIYNLKVKRSYMVLGLISFVGLMVFRIPYALFMQSISGYEYGIYDDAGTLIFTTMIVAIYLITIWKLPAILKISKNSKHFVNALIIALIFTPLTWVNPSAMRVVQYFSIFLLLLLPSILLSFKKEEYKIVYVIALSTLVLLFLLNNPSYLFFWQ